MLHLVKVANILRYGLNANLRNRLTLAAEEELVSLLASLQDFLPSEEEDQHLLVGGSDFSTKHAYDVLMRKSDLDLIAPLIWQSKAPQKLKVFAWLLFKNRLNTRVNLAHKSIISSNLCPRCLQLSEDTIHLFITCPLADRVWQRVGIVPLAADINELWDLALPRHLPPKAWPLVLLTILWKIWAARNDMLFRSTNQRFVITLRLVISDLDLGHIVS